MKEREGKQSEKRPVPSEITKFLKACREGEDYGKLLSEINAEDMTELLYGIDWESPEAGPILAAYRREARRDIGGFKPWIPHPIPELPEPVPPNWGDRLIQKSGSELYEWLEREKLVEEFRYCILCCCWWCCCGCDCFPPRLCRCSCCGYHTIRVYPRGGVTHSAVYARSLRFVGADVETGASASEAEITVPSAFSDLDGTVGNDQLPGSVLTTGDVDRDTLGKLTGGGVIDLHSHVIGCRHTVKDNLLSTETFGAVAGSGATLTIMVDSWAGVQDVNGNLDADRIHVSATGMAKKTDGSGDWLPLILADWSVTEGTGADSGKLIVKIVLCDTDGVAYLSDDNMRYRVDIYGTADGDGDEPTGTPLRYHKW